MSEHPYVVVVGVSATSKSQPALAWADAQAKLNQGHLIAVRAWRTPSPQATPSGTPASRISHDVDVEREARAELEQDVTAALGADHSAELRLEHGSTFQVLIAAARGADLLVVDAPRQLFVGPMFAHRLVYAATCPVVVMPPEVSGEPQSLLVRAAEAVGRSVVAAAGTAGRPGYRRPIYPEER